jgi:hypothetical protein
MPSSNDDLEKALQQNLKLRRELGAQVAKASDIRAKQMLKRPQSHRSPQVTSTEARQGTGPRAMFWVLIGSLTLAVIAGLALGIAFGWIPRPWSGPL